MSSVQAETLLYYLQNQNQVSFAKVYDRTGDAVICYEGERAAVIRMIQLFHYEEVELPTGLLESSGRALNNEYQEKLISKVFTTLEENGFFRHRSVPSILRLFP